ncbi:NAD(P)H-quinone oxidoreductase [Kineococcus glutinatus]|uniref:NAD(P)H-quinone oxidoreductase n=1 Tax=Kineococcus glutinatus TaxID=1070872 RepID=UPI0031EF22D2
MTVREPGGPDVLVPTELPDPAAGPGEVLVRVAAAGVNRADLMQRQGRYPPPPGAPQHPGLEVSGTVEALGEGVSGWEPGQQVCALLAGGGYAELVAVPAGQLLPVPAGVGLVEAAALPEVTCTVWSNVFDVGRLVAGEVLLVHGGSSGIGTMAVQLGAAAGARVAVTAGSAEKLRRCAELGAEVLVDYREQDFAEVVRAATGGRGADVVLDVVGAGYLQRNVDVLATGGRLVVIGMQGGVRGELDLQALMARRASVHATSLRARPLADKARVVAGVREHVWPLLASGRVRPVVHEVLPLAEAARAHELLEGSSHVGKVLLAV